MNIKFILSVAIVATAVIGFGFKSFNQDENQQVDIQQAIVSPVDKHKTVQTAQSTVEQVAGQTALSTSASTQDSPNYDRRSMVVANTTAPKPTMTSAQSTKVINEKQAEMEKLVAQYNSALSDPKRKADIERKFKLHMEDYKLALIAKVQRGEL